MPDPTVDSWPRINMFAMLRALIDNGVPILTNAGAPTSGTSGSFVGKAGPGALLIDYTNGVLYINMGTKLSPLWGNASGPIASTGGLAAVGNAKMTYDFTVDGGAISTITPTNSPTIPQGAVIIGGFIDVTTLLTSGGAATVGLGLGSGAQVASLLAPITVAGAPWSTTGIKPIIPVFTAATAVKVAAATRLTLTIAAFTVTAGKFDVNIQYQMGN